VSRAPWLLRECCDPHWFRSETSHPTRDAIKPFGIEQPLLSLLGSLPHPHRVELVEQVPFLQLNLTYFASNPLIMSQRSELSSFQMILRLLLGFAIGLSLPGLFVNAVLRASDITACPNALPEMSSTLVMQSKMSTGNWQGGKNSTLRQCRAKASSKIHLPPTARSHPVSVPTHMGVRYTRPKNLDAVI
jgi:hypothetical protein